MCAAIEAVEQPMDPAEGVPAGEADHVHIITIWSEAAILFKDTGERNDFTPGAAARCMPGLREQRKNREFCDIAIRALDGSEIWAHRFVMAARRLTTVGDSLVALTIGGDNTLPREQRCVKKWLDSFRACHIFRPPKRPRTVKRRPSDRVFRSRNSEALRSASPPTPVSAPLTYAAAAQDHHVVY
ncbi:hypothetical protein MTO96_025135 [Rhipicephalus appendiculatus]